MMGDHPDRETRNETSVGSGDSGRRFARRERVSTYDSSTAKASYQREVDVEGALKIIDTITAPLLAYKSKLDLEFREWRPGDPGVR